MTRAGRDTAIGSPPRPRRGVRPVRPVVPLLSCGALVLAWGLVAHNSGAGWVQAVGDVLAGILLVGLVAPAVACARARVRVLDSPADGTAGMPVELTALASSACGCGRCTPPAPRPSSAPTSRRARPGAPPPASPVAPGDSAPARPRHDQGTLTLLPERRGVHEDVVIELSSAAPFGLLWWRRTVRVALPRPLHVAPRMGEPFPFPRGMHDAAVGDAVATPGPLRRAARRAAVPVRETCGASCTGPPPRTAAS